MKYSQKRRKIKLQEGVQILQSSICAVFPRSEFLYHVATLRMNPWLEGQMKALGGVTANGGEGDDMPPMNSRGGLSLMNPKAFIG